MSVATTTAEAATPSFGEGSLIAPGIDDVRAAFSGADWRPSVVATTKRTSTTPSRASVLQLDSRNRWRRRFALPSVGTGPQRYAIVPLERGSIAVLYDDSTRHQVLARTIRATGAVEPAVVVLRDVVTQEYNIHGDIVPEWEFEADRKGTVVVTSTARVASTGNNAIVAAAREPGGRFAPQQQLDAGAPFADCLCPDPSAIARRYPRVSPIAADGSVSVFWHRQAEGGLSRRVQAARAGRAPFGPATEVAFPADDSLTAAARANTGRGVEVRGEFSTRVRVAPDVVAVCAADGACTDPRLYTWRDGSAAILFTPYTQWRLDYPRGMWTATRQKDGTFAKPVRITKTNPAPAFTLRTPERLAITLRDHAVPFGTGLSDAHPPQIVTADLGRFPNALVIRAACNERCRVDAFVTVGRRTALAHRTRGLLAPLEETAIEYDTRRLHKGTIVRFRIVARDRSGHRTVKRVTTRV